MQDRASVKFWQRKKQREIFFLRFITGSFKNLAGICIIFVMEKKNFWENFWFGLHKFMGEGVSSVWVSLRSSPQQCGVNITSVCSCIICSVGIQPWPQSVEHFNLLIFALEEVPSNLLWCNGKRGLLTFLYTAAFSRMMIRNTHKILNFHLP